MRSRLGIAVIVLCLLGVASPAMAEVDVDSDPRNDLTRYTQSEGSTEVRVEAAEKTQRRADITRFRTAHRPNRLLMRLQVREVKRDRLAQVNVGFSVRGSDGRLWVVGLSYWKREYADFTRLHSNRAPVEVECPGLRVKAWRKHDAYSVSVPRQCFGSPRWVRTGAVVGLTRFANPYKTWVDRARMSTLVKYDSPPHLGPRVLSGQPSDRPRS